MAADPGLTAAQPYKDGWLRPGGIVEHNEAPHAGAERELLEETGLHRASGQLLASYDLGRFVAAVSARASGTTAYLVDGWALASD